MLVFFVDIGLADVLSMQRMTSTKFTMITLWKYPHTRRSEKMLVWERGRYYSATGSGQLCGEWTLQELIERAFMEAAISATTGKLNGANVEDLLNEEFGECDLTAQEKAKITKAYKKLAQKCIEALQTHVQTL